jgi:flagellar hook assembly protein FlgD
MKRIAILFLLLTCSIWSQTYYYNVWSKGTLTSVPVSEIRKITFDSVSGAAENNQTESVISTFELFQNYPNPFNPTTTIEYQVPSTGRIQIQIYNITGNLIRTLVNSDQPSGKYSITWSGKDESNHQVATGVYIYRVVFGSSVLSKKMLLLK